AKSRRTKFRRSAFVVARAAVEPVVQQVDANGAAPGKPGSAPWVKADSLVAIRRRRGADVPAGAAVVGVRVERRAGPVAADGAFDARGNAVAVDARAILVGAGLRTHAAARAAVGDVVGEIGAVVAAAGATEAAGDPGARPAGGEAGVLLRPVAAP